MSSCLCSLRARVARGRLTLVHLALVLLVGAPEPARAQSADAVVQWHRVLLTAMGVPGAVPSTVFPARPLAVFSVAVFDAANTFDLVYRPYATRVAPAEGASRDAALAQAARDVLVAMFPTQAETFDRELATALAGIPSAAARDGAAVGAAVAKATLALRAGDGWSRSPPPYDLPSLPGYWKPTPPASVPAAFTHYPDVKGFVIGSRDRFLMEGPPSLTSERYARDFDETKAIGAVDSTVRTAEQTQLARLFAGVGTPTSPFVLWNTLLGDLARARGLNGLDTARAYALMNIANHDAFLTSFNGKFLYGLWRPVTAIREADRDGNEATVADPSWTPLLVTPPYPGHPGNMACSTAAQAQVIARVFDRPDLPIQVAWTVPNAPLVTRLYGNIHALANDAARSRIWGGIHFDFESQASIGVCSQLGDYAADNYLRRR